MKRANINIKKAFLLFLCGVVMTACGYEEIVSMDYPDSKIYLPTAVNGIYVINDIPSSSNEKAEAERETTLEQLKIEMKEREEAQIQL